MNKTLGEKNLRCLLSGVHRCEKVHPLLHTSHCPTWPP